MEGQVRYRHHNPAYAARLRARSWQVVIPILGKLSPLVWYSDFRTKEAADEWLVSEAGRLFVASAQAERRLPAAPSNIEVNSASQAVDASVSHNF
jgi:hypothetical protein